MKEVMIFHYVPHSRQKVFEDLGWVFDRDIDPPHAAYASLYRWGGEGEPKYPPDDIGVMRNVRIEVDYGDEGE